MALEQPLKNLHRQELLGKPLSGITYPSFWQSFKASFAPAPRLFKCIQVEVSSHCLAKCSYCPHTTHKNTWYSRNLSPKTFIALKSLLEQSQRVHLQGWGEPLLNPHFLDYVATAMKLNCRVSTTSCGLIMSPDLAKVLVESGLDILAFSLTGTCASSNASRQGADFSTVCQNIITLQNIRQKLCGVHLEVHLAYLLLASQVQALYQLPKLMQELGIHASIISTLDYLPQAEWADEAFNPHDTQKIQAAQKILEEITQEAAQLGLSIYYSLPQPKTLPICREQQISPIYIDACGNVSPCIYSNLPISNQEHLVFGNVNIQDGLEIYKAPDFQNFRNNLQGPCLTCAKRFEA